MTWFSISFDGTTMTLVSKNAVSGETYQPTNVFVYLQAGLI